MMPTRWKEIERLFHAAMERPTGERSAFLAEACGEDRELRHEVEMLLAQEGSLLDRPAWESIPETTVTQVISKKFFGR
jgi:hypothetical protein